METHSSLCRQRSSQSKDQRPQIPVIANHDCLTSQQVSFYVRKGVLIILTSGSLIGHKVYWLGTRTTQQHTTSGRTFALIEIQICPLSTLKVADVQISASLSHVPPPAELIVIVQYIALMFQSCISCLHREPARDKELVWSWRKRCVYLGAVFQYACNRTIHQELFILSDIRRTLQ